MANRSETELALADLRAEIRRVEADLAKKSPDSMTGYGSTGRAHGPYLERLRRDEATYAARVAAQANEEA